MTRNIYALLVGINSYSGSVPNLSGCVNDVKSILELLQLRTKDGAFELKPLILTSGDPDNPNEEKPTRQAVIDAFRKHLRRAGQNDVALFYYSGHGSQELAPEPFWPLEPDHLNETIVCVDSRLPGNYDLADKELALLLQEVTTQDEHGRPKANAPHTVVILDACHSGSGTREADDTRIRLAQTDTRARPLSSYLVTPEAAKALADSDSARNGKDTADWFMPPRGRHVLLSACTANETAKERSLGDAQKPHGIFSYYLLELLQRSGPGLTYYDVLTRVRQQVTNTVAMQTPQIKSTDPKDQTASFLDGAVQPRPAFFQVNWSKNDDSWVLDAGCHAWHPGAGRQSNRDHAAGVVSI